jgi:hypothetical protein
MIEGLIEYSVDGRKVSAGDFARSVEHSGFAVAAEQINETLQSLRCGEHSGTPTVVVADDDGELTLRIKACCAESETNAAEALASSEAEDASSH